MYPNDRYYTNDHEWIAVSGKTARVGITDYAQQQLGEVVFVEVGPGRVLSGLVKRTLGRGVGIYAVDEIEEIDAVLAALG